MVLFEHPGGENTRAALALALDAANKHGLDIVVSTTGGGTVPPLLEMAREAGYSGRIVAVTLAPGKRAKTCWRPKRCRNSGTTALRW